MSWILSRTVSSQMFAGVIHLQHHADVIEAIRSGSGNLHSQDCSACNFGEGSHIDWNTRREGAIGRDLVLWWRVDAGVQHGCRERKGGFSLVGGAC